MSEEQIHYGSSSPAPHRVSRPRTTSPGESKERRLREELEQANRMVQQAQSQLAQAGKMASLGQLFAGLIHELNNPLTFTVNCNRTASKLVESMRIEKELTDSMRSRLARIEAQIESMQKGHRRMTELISNLRMFSRFDDGRLSPMDVHESIDTALLFLEHKMKGRIEVSRRYGAAGPLVCYAGGLNQVFLNLLANAVDAIPGQGSVEIETSIDHRTYQIYIRDDGTGIPEAVRSRIFEPLFTTKSAAEGTGLGLAISSDIVRAHRGQIEARSRSGRGTEFCVSIPTDLEATLKC